TRRSLAPRRCRRQQIRAARGLLLAQLLIQLLHLSPHTARRSLVARTRRRQQIPAAVRFLLAQLLVELLLLTILHLPLQLLHLPHLSPQGVQLALRAGRRAKRRAQRTEAKKRT